MKNQQEVISQSGELWTSLGAWLARRAAIIVAAVLALGAGNVLAQDQAPATPTPRQGGGAGGGFGAGGGGGFGGNGNGQRQQRQGFGGGNFSQDQMQQMIMQRLSDMIRPQLAVTNDADWDVIQTRLGKVIQIKITALMNQASGFRAMGGGRGGGGGGRGGFGGMMPANPEVDALQTGLDNDAPTADLKVALKRLRDARARQQSDLTKAEDALKEVLTTRQEAVLVANGLLD